MAAGALLLAAALLCGEALAAEAPKSATKRAAQESLLEREPLGFDVSTLAKLEQAWALLPELPAKLGEQSRTLGVTGTTLVAALLVAIAYTFFGQRRFAAGFEQSLEPSMRRFPAVGRPWISAFAQVVAAGLLPLALWALQVLTAELTGYRHPAFVLLGGLLLVWAEFGVAATAMRELLRRPLLPIPAEHGRYLHRIGFWLLFYAILVAAALDALSKLGVPGDVVALWRAAFKLSLIAILAAAVSRKSAVLALLPDVPNRLYRGFIRFLDRVYPLALALTVATALLSLAGYHRLAAFVWVRTWALAGIFVAAVLVIHLAHGRLRAWVMRQGADPEKASAFNRSAGRMLDYVGAVTTVLLALELTRLRAPLGAALSVPMYRVAEREVSPLLFGAAAVIIVAFILLARLSRDYLDFRVYPTLNVEEGVAHAISTFVFWMLIVVGVLSAVEAVGLGIGSITIFAGALGIGVGFGLQSLASNLASGLVLIFTRALRKGDWVSVGDTVGMIEEVGIRATRLRTRDAVEYLVPNADFVAQTIINWTRTIPLARHHVPVGVSYGSAPEEIRDILLRIATESPLVEKAPAPEVWFVGFGESSLDFELLVWANVKRYSEKQVRSELYFGIFRAFKEAGIEIPFPQRDVHIKGAPVGKPEDS